MTPRNADEADSSQTTKMSVQCSMHMGRCSISTWTPLHAVSTFVLSTIQCPEPQAPKPASSIEEHPRKLQQPQHQQDDSDLWLHNCQSKSMGRKLLPLCCAVLCMFAVVGVAPIHDSVGLHCQRRLPLPFAVSIGISASTFTSNSIAIAIAIATAISMSHVPSLMSMSVAVVVNICHDLIVKRSHVAAMALLPCPRLPPFWNPRATPLCNNSSHLGAIIFLDTLTKRDPQPQMD